MNRPTIDEVRAEPAGRRLRSWVALYALGWHTYDHHGIAYYFKPGYDSRVDVPPTSDNLPAWDTDPAACAELRRHLWASGRFRVIDSELYHSQTAGPHVMASVQPYGGRAVVHEEPIGTDPIAAECVAWCKVALLAELSNGVE